MPAPLDFRNYGYGGANIISGLSGLFDTSEAELRRSVSYTHLTLPTKA